MSIHRTRPQPTALILIALTLVGCGGAPAVDLEAADATPAVDIPADVLGAREAVLDFLRDGANECVPAENAPWQARAGGEEAPEGFGLYYFTSDGCAMTVSYPLPASEDTVYHVSIGDQTTGYCWQATVSAAGKILQTGSAAEPGDVPENPAAVYCREQGYQYEVREQADGSRCGLCVFPDGSTCVSWAFLRGQCQPGDRPAEGP